MNHTEIASKPLANLNALPTQNKLNYNLANPYFSPLFPLLAYIFLRNISPWMRARFLGPLEATRLIRVRRGRVGLGLFMTGCHAFDYG